MNTTRDALEDAPIGVIVAGGLGTRLGDAARARPKPMLPIGGVPLIARQIEQFRRAGIGRVVILAGHRSEVIEVQARGWSDERCRVEVVVESQPLGSGGCLSLVPGHGPRVVAFGDVVFEMDLRALVQAHRRHEARVTAVVHPNDHPHDSDLVELDPRGRLVALHTKPHPLGLEVRNLVTAGVFVVDAALTRALPTGRKLDLVHDILARAHRDGEPIFGYETSEYLKDMGTPSRYRRVCDDWERGLVQGAALPRRTAFLDRDGTINRHVGYVSRPEQIELLPGVGSAIRSLNRAGVQVVVVTNQPVVARGMCDETQLRAIHARLEGQLGAEGAYLDRLYYCPHHPHRGFEGERVELKVECDCRKPAPGLLLRAMSELRVDVATSAMFGDSLCDAQAGMRAGVEPLLLGDGVRSEALRRGVRWFPHLPAAIAAWLAREAIAC
ncbi:MAG: HAD-IIIA family hydrolase [Myxococcota bacterium]